MVQVESWNAKWLGIVRLAVRQLRQRWLESLFILLGIALGVGVFTGMETYIRFSETMTQDLVRSNPQILAVRVQAQSFDLNTFYQSQTPAVRLDPTLSAPLQLGLDDLLALREALPVVGPVFMSGSSRSSAVRAIDGENVGSAFDPTAGGAPLQLSVRSTSPDELVYTERSFLAGSSYTWEDVANGEHRLVLDEQAAKTLFPDLAPEETVGHTVTAGTTTGTPISPGVVSASGIVWTIVGVVEAAGDPFGFPSSNAVQAYGPPGAFGSETYRELSILPAVGVSIEEMVREVQAYANQVYGEGKVTVREPLASLDSGNSYMIALLALSGLALLIAAVNILNLFTARVLRRQRYTGMSVALGATRSMLFWQTAGEAILLGVFGSVLGLFIAHGLVRLLVIFFTSSSAGLPGSNPYDSISMTTIDAAVGLGIGTGISLLFGLYPGWLASRQEPAEALRTE